MVELSCVSNNRQSKRDVFRYLLLQKNLYEALLFQLSGGGEGGGEGGQKEINKQKQKDKSTHMKRTEAEAEEEKALSRPVCNKVPRPVFPFCNCVVAH